MNVFLRWWPRLSWPVWAVGLVLLFCRDVWRPLPTVGAVVMIGGGLVTVVFAIGLVRQFYKKRRESA